MLIIDVDPANPLPVGSYTFQLEVDDDSGNGSTAVEVQLTVVDEAQAPRRSSARRARLPFGKDFTLSGEESSDVGGGKIAVPSGR